MTHTPLYGAFLLTISMKTRIPKKSITVCSMLPAASFCSCGWGCGHGKTTALRRLKSVLDGQDYTVLYLLNLNLPRDTSTTVFWSSWGVKHGSTEVTQGIYCTTKLKLCVELDTENWL